MLVQYGKDCRSIRSHDEVGSVRKTTEQATSNGFFNEWKLERVFANTIEQDIELCHKLETDSAPLLLAPECGSLDVIAGLWQDEWD